MSINFNKETEAKGIKICKQVPLDTKERNIPKERFTRQLSTKYIFMISYLEHRKNIFSVFILT